MIYATVFCQIVNNKKKVLENNGQYLNRGEQNE